MDNLMRHRGLQILSGRVLFGYGLYQLHTLVSSTVSPGMSIGTSTLLVSVTNISASLLVGSLLLFKP